MNPQSPSEVNPSWTWADQISSYRYWGLLAFYSLSIVGGSSIFMTFPILVAERGLSATQVAVLASSIQVGGLFGFFLAWTATRKNPVKTLLFFAVLQLSGAALMATQVLVAMVIGAAVFGAGAAAVLISVPAIIAGGRGGVEAFMVAFAAVAMFAGIVKSAAPALAAIFLLNIPSPAAPLIFIGIPVTVGLIFLSRVDRGLFNEPPALRVSVSEPRKRTPLTVTWLGVIPLFGLFYGLRWLFRAHGDVIAIAPSPRLLSPRSAVVAAVLIPFLVPVMTTTLTDLLNNRAMERGLAPLQSPMAIFLWSLVFYPVALGLVQSAINRSLELDEYRPKNLQAVSDNESE